MQDYCDYPYIKRDKPLFIIREINGRKYTEIKYTLETTDYFNTHTHSFYYNEKKRLLKIICYRNGISRVLWSKNNKKSE